MNRRPSGLQLSKAVEGLLQYKTAEGLSSSTMISYRHHLKVFLEYQLEREGDIDIARVMTPQLRRFITYMLTEYKPRRIFGNNEERVSPKTVRNWWITLSALFRWASDEFQLPNPMKGVHPPKFTDKPVEPFTKEEIESLLNPCDYRKEAQTEDRHKFTMRRCTGYRDRAIILTLLDTGLRASELCALGIDDLDTKTGKINVRHGYSGGAKGRKGRIVSAGKVARKGIWRYLASREDGDDQDAPHFLGRLGRPFNRDALWPQQPGDRADLCQNSRGGPGSQPPEGLAGG